MGLNYGEVDEITDITVGDREVFKGSITNNTIIIIDKPDLFGGDESEGGIQGTLDVMFGAPNQTPSSKLAAMVGHAVSAFRKRTTLLFDGMVCALSKYPKPWAIRRNRRLKGWDGGVWYPEKAQINLPGGIKAMNPVHIIFEALTNRDWGDKKPRSKLDDAAFRAAADKAYAEGFGLCIQYTHQSPIKDFIYDVQNHIGANVFQSRTTGLWTIRLVRNDYDVNTLLTFTPNSGLLGIDDDDNSAPVKAANEIIVLYTRVAENKEGQVRVQNPAGIRGAGGVISETVSYSGIPTPELALRVAQRDLRAKFSAKKFKVRLNRRAFKIEDGGVFRVSDPARGIQNLVLRAGKIDYGTLNAGTITVSAVLDVFGLPSNSYVAPQPSTYTPPSYEPEPVTGRVISEATYRDLVRTLSPSDIAALTPGTNLLTATGAAPTGMSLSFELEARVGTGTWNSSDGDFCPSAVLVNAIPKGIVPIAISMSNLMGGSVIELGSACVIDSEIFRVDAINIAAQTATLARGCIDTVPAAHAAGARVLFYQDYMGVDRTEYAAGVTVQARLRTRTGAGVLSPGGAPIDNYLMSRRKDRPYAPGNVTINGIAYPAVISNAAMLSWAHRDRTIQADQLIDSSVSHIGPEPGTNYAVVVKGEGGVTIANQASSGTILVINETSQGVVYDAPAPSDISVVGMGLVSSAAADRLAASLSEAVGGFATSFNPVDAGYLNFNHLKGEFINSSTGAKTSRNRAANWATDTFATLLTKNPAAYVARIVITSTGGVVSYDPYSGFAVMEYESAGVVRPIGGASDNAMPSVIRDRRATSRCIVALTTRTASFGWWASNYDNHRVILHRQWRLHKITKAQVLTGPLTSTGVTMDGFHVANPAQFNSASGQYVGYSPASGGRLQYGYMGESQIFAQLGVIFGGLMYVPHLAASAVVNTAGKAVNITNVLNAHIDCATSVTDKTAVYSIDLDGNFSLLATRDGLVLADQVSATQGVEITNGVIRTVNSSTGVLGSVIATLPGSVKALRVVGDPITETFFVLGEDGKVYKYDVAGVLISSLQLPLSSRPTLPTWLVLEYPIQLEVSAGYLYVVPEISFQSVPAATYKVDKNLTGFSVFQFSDVLGGMPVAGDGQDVYRWYLRASPDNSLLLKGKLMDESASATSIIALETPRLHDTLTIDLQSQRDGLDSHQKHTITVQRRGYGLRYGQSYED